MSAPIYVTIASVVPPATGSNQYGITCSPTNGVDSNCTISADMWFRVSDTRNINLTLPKGYSFINDQVCVGKVGVVCDPSHSTWKHTGGIAPNQVTINATQYLWDLKYTLYIKDNQHASIAINIDPMIRNGIKPIMDIFAIIVLLGLVALGVLSFKRFRANAATGN